MVFILTLWTDMNGEFPGWENDWLSPLTTSPEIDDP